MVLQLVDDGCSGGINSADQWPSISVCATANGRRPGKKVARRRAAAGKDSGNGRTDCGIQVEVTGKRLAKRILFTLALTAGLFIFLTAIQAQATPIRPDIRKLVSQPQQDSSAEFMPARAGWDGPEMPRRMREVNPALAIYDSTATARAARAALLQAAIPDPRALLGIVTVIFLLRILRKGDDKRTARARSLAPHPAEMEDLAA